jgi:hypothetical protein
MFDRTSFSVGYEVYYSGPDPIEGVIIALSRLGDEQRLVLWENGTKSWVNLSEIQPAL